MFYALCTHWFSDIFFNNSTNFCDLLSSAAGIDRLAVQLITSELIPQMTEEEQAQWGRLHDDEKEAIIGEALLAISGIPRETEEKGSPLMAEVEEEIPIVEDLMGKEEEEVEEKMIEAAMANDGGEIAEEEEGRIFLWSFLNEWMKEWMKMNDLMGKEEEEEEQVEEKMIEAAMANDGGEIAEGMNEGRILMKLCEWKNEWMKMNEWMNEWMDGWMNEWMDENEWMD